MSDNGRRYKTLEQTLRYTGLTVGALKKLIEVGGLRFINTGDGPVFETHDLQKAMHRIKTDGMAPVVDYFMKARIAEIEAANAQRREAEKDKPKRTIVFNDPKENSGKPPFTIETVPNEAPVETPEGSEESKDIGSCEDTDAGLLF